MFFSLTEIEECFEPLKLANGDHEYEVKSRENTLFPVTLSLPAHRLCDACIFRWNWQAGE